jgi:16S rRNA U516 pseudouridylate synthase RsuA-like enzyme
MTERLQKLLASAGHGSRRGIEDWIRAGRVTINDRVAALGDRAETTDRICLDGKPLDLGGRKDAVEVLLYHKPVGEMTTRNDPEGSHTWIRVSLHEGRNREVRRLFEHEGFVVSRLTRIRYGSVELPRDLRTGAFNNLTPGQISELARLAGGG